MKFSEEQLKIFEIKFGENERVKHYMAMVGYFKMDEEQRSLSWKLMAHIVKEEFGFIIPGTEEKTKSVKEIIEEQEKEILFRERQEKKFELKIQILKSINIKRIYIIDETKGEIFNCNIKFPLIVNKKKCVFPIHSGQLEFVKYYSTFANYKAIEFTENTVGIITSGMGDCISVMFLMGKLKSDSCYWGGSLAHLPGGNYTGLNWSKMVFGLKPNKLRKYLTVEPLYAQVLICVQKYRFTTGKTVFKLISECIMPLGFGFQQIVVYIGDISGGFGFLKCGGFGTLSAKRLKSFFPDI